MFRLALLFLYFFVVCIVSATIVFCVFFRSEIIHAIRGRNNEKSNIANNAETFVGQVDARSESGEMSVAVKGEPYDLQDVDVKYIRGFNKGLFRELFDRGGAVLILIVLFPLLFFLSLGIKLSSDGPVIFRRQRIGLDGKKFYSYAFRTMYLDTNEHVIYASKRDPRITRIGAFMRRYSIDELPQLYNVLIGDMSLVGPRPYAGECEMMTARMISGYEERHFVKPGLTGWAQVYGVVDDGDLRKARLQAEFDMKYVRSNTIWLDCKILLCTFVPLLRDWLLEDTSVL